MPLDGCLRLLVTSSALLLLLVPRGTSGNLSGRPAVGNHGLQCCRVSVFVLSGCYSLVADLSP